MKILLAVDGSDISTRAAEYVVRLAASLEQPPQVVLFNVDPPLSSSIAAQLGVEAVAMHHSENSRRMMQPAHRVLSAARLKVDEEEHVGPVADTIVKHAKKLGVDMIVMGSRGTGALKGMFLGSVSSRVLAQSPVPVTIVR
ncbi:MAG TPA: universal stress protein [Lysobacter sp.]|nr:universal stress protein [Lysobacter sp.]